MARGSPRPVWLGHKNHVAPRQFQPAIDCARHVSGIHVSGMRHHTAQRANFGFGGRAGRDRRCTFPPRRADAAHWPDRTGRLQPVDELRSTCSLLASEGLPYRFRLPESLRRLQRAKHCRRLLQRHRLGPYIGAQPGGLHRRANRGQLILTAQIVDQRLALLREGQFEERDERLLLPPATLPAEAPWSAAARWSALPAVVKMLRAAG